MNEKRAQNELRLWEVTEMEGVFARIRQAIGVKTLEEIVLKLVHQSANDTTLEEEKREAESKLARAKAARQSKAGRFSHVKTIGVGNTELNREISDKLDDEIQALRSEVGSTRGNTFRGTHCGAPALSLCVLTVFPGSYCRREDAAIVNETFLGKGCTPQVTICRLRFGLQIISWPLWYTWAPNAKARSGKATSATGKFILGRPSG